MAKLAAEIYEVKGRQKKTAHLWRTILNWFAFFFRILLQLLRGTPPLAQLLSHVRVQRPLLFSSGNEFPASGAGFKPLTAETPTSTPAPPPPVALEATFEKLTIVLDLDQTLVCAYDTISLPSVIRSQGIAAGLKCFELEFPSSEKDVDGKSRVNHVTVFERPGLHDFLQEISEFANVVLFTAGLEWYARPLVDKIDVDNRFILRLYRPATVSTEYRQHVKDLSCLSKDFSRIVIVDNNPFSFLLQPLNGIPCVPFYARQSYDEQLLGVILPLLKHLSHQKDVRPVLYERFHMPKWFQKHGIPTSNWIT